MNITHSPDSATPPAASATPEPSSSAPAATADGPLSASGGEVGQLHPFAAPLARTFMEDRHGRLTDTEDESAEDRWLARYGECLDLLDELFQGRLGGYPPFPEAAGEPAPPEPPPNTLAADGDSKPFLAL